MAKNKGEKADFTIRIYRSTGKKLKIIAAKKSSTMAKTVEELVEAK